MRQQQGGLHQHAVQAGQGQLVLPQTVSAWKQVLPRPRCRVRHQIGLPVHLSVGRRVLTCLRVVRGERDRRPDGTTTIESAWCNRRFGRVRRHGSRRRGRHGSPPLQRTEGVGVATGAVVGRNALGDQIGVDRIRAERVLMHRKRLIGLVAVADLHGGRPLSRLAHTRVVARTAHPPDW